MTVRYLPIPTLPPCEIGEEAESCETCGDTGNSPVVNGPFKFDAPCPACFRGDWLDEMFHDSGAGR